MTEEQEQKPAVEKNPHIYKPAYTKQEVDELTRWFEERMDRLPATLQLNGGDGGFRPSAHGESPIGGAEGS